MTSKFPFDKIKPYIFLTESCSIGKVTLRK